MGRDSFRKRNLISRILRALIFNASCDLISHFNEIFAPRKAKISFPVFLSGYPGNPKF